MESQAYVQLGSYSAGRIKKKGWLQQEAKQLKIMIDFGTGSKMITESRDNMKTKNKRII